ncbi:hypothetical protein B0H14DRAFT_3429741 [Mycena olivaceomarginata]|nr:hypothetical protein B0H14DRAFT_3429741 [Mycena olivaceomarginata]
MRVRIPSTDRIMATVILRFASFDSRSSEEVNPPPTQSSQGFVPCLQSAALRAFYGDTTPPRQYYCRSEMYALLEQRGSSVENMQSISNTFIIDTRVVENGSTVFTLIDIVLLTSGQRGICSSEITGLWFLSQRTDSSPESIAAC